jgi:S-DNA-T family DNA segregation ATPase FtsK/SpoIIIE
VIVINEYADMMDVRKKAFEDRIREIAQKARAVGIHLVIATQRPSVDVITDTIKANIPSRIAGRVGNYCDSLTVLGEGGAEKLVGYCDMLYKNLRMLDVERCQGAVISSSEIEKVVKYIIENNDNYDELKVQL